VGPVWKRALDGGYYAVIVSRRVVGTSKIVGHYVNHSGYSPDSVAVAPDCSFLASLVADALGGMLFMRYLPRASRSINPAFSARRRRLVAARSFIRSSCATSETDRAPSTDRRNSTTARTASGVGPLASSRIASRGRPCAAESCPRSRRCSVSRWARRLSSSLSNSPIR